MGVMRLVRRVLRLNIRVFINLLGVGGKSEGRELDVILKFLI